MNDWVGCLDGRKVAPFAAAKGLPYSPMFCGFDRVTRHSEVGQTLTSTHHALPVDLRQSTRTESWGMAALGLASFLLREATTTIVSAVPTSPLNRATQELHAARRFWAG
jgi:hypothetical protein